MEENKSLKSFNTFGINSFAKHFSTFSSTDELEEIVASNTVEKTMILGGGSNILFTKDFDGLVLKNEIKGMEIIEEDDEFAYCKAGAGESWHQFVLFTLSKGLGGLENLSLIPGNVGASPMQNIGAYGVEIKDVFHTLEAFDMQDEVMVSFDKDNCEFGYRESIFKRKFKDLFVITSVTYKLSKHPRLNMNYAAIEQELEQMHAEPSIHTVSQAVINIRQSKLPDPKQIGNAGSFFKNPSVSEAVFGRLKKEYPAIPGYPQGDGTVKIFAGWLIEQCNWKGFRRGDAGCHAKHALVLVNYGNATGEEIYQLSEEILSSVRSKFDITLEREVNII